MCFGIATLNVLVIVLMVAIVTKFVWIEPPIAAALGGMISTILTYLLISQKRFAKQVRKDEVDKLVDRLMENSELPHEKYEKKLLDWIIVAFEVLIIFVELAFLFSGKKIEIIASVMSAVMVAVITFLLKEKGQVRLMIDQERSTIKLYCSEFHDTMRSMRASVKVMLCIREELLKDRNKRVEWIHFRNMFIPETSILFSDDMLKYLPRTCVNDFSHLRTILRNANNSSLWLRRKAIRGECMLEAVDWELTRYFGNLLRMEYLANHGFRFFCKYDELTNYVKESGSLEKMKKELKDDMHDFSKDVDEFYARFLNDRKSGRAVLCY